jgi:hypothetical protein
MGPLSAAPAGCKSGRILSRFSSGGDTLGGRERIAPHPPFDSPARRGRSDKPRCGNLEGRRSRGRRPGRGRVRRRRVRAHTRADRARTTSRTSSSGETSLTDIRVRHCFSNSRSSMPRPAGRSRAPRSTSGTPTRRATTPASVRAAAAAGSCAGSRGPMRAGSRASARFIRAGIRAGPSTSTSRFTSAAGSSTRATVLLRHADRPRLPQRPVQQAPGSNDSQRERLDLRQRRPQVDAEPSSSKCGRLPRQDHHGRAPLLKLAVGHEPFPWGSHGFSHGACLRSRGRVGVILGEL